MKNSKKGITLVELIICCAIIVMLGGACSAVLASGATIFNQSSSTANAQLDADVLQRYMRNILPSAKTVTQLNEGDAMDRASAKYLFFDESNSNMFTIRVDGSDTSIRSISGFTYSIVRAGDADSENARIQFNYTATLTDGSILEGGFVLGNAKFQSEISGDLKLNPIGFNLPAPTPPAGET